MLRAEKRNDLLEEILQSKEDAIALQYVIESHHDYSVDLQEKELLLETDPDLKKMLQDNIDSQKKAHGERREELAQLIRRFDSTATKISEGRGGLTSGAALEEVRGLALMNRQELSETRALINDAHRREENRAQRRAEFRRKLEEQRNGSSPKESR